MFYIFRRLFTSSALLCLPFSDDNDIYNNNDNNYNKNNNDKK